MPWCDTCDRFLSPSTVLIDGTCPACGRPVDAGKARAPLAADSPSTPALTASPPVARDGATIAAAASDDDEELGPIPWHLKLLAAALAVYLGYRAMQGIEWILGK